MNDEQRTDTSAVIPSDSWHDAPHPSMNSDNAPRRFASSSSFFSVKPKIVSEEVHFPEKDQWLRFRAITQAEFRRASSLTLAYDSRTKQRDPERDKDFNIMLFIAGAVDDDGNNVFDYADYKRLQDEPYSVINRGAEIVTRLSGIGDDVMGKQRRKNVFGVSEDEDEN